MAQTNFREALTPADGSLALDANNTEPIVDQSAEQPEPLPTTEPEHHFHPTPSGHRMRALLRVSEILNGKAQVEGLENLDRIPEGAKVIIVTTHLTDRDEVTAAAALRHHFDVVLTGWTGAVTSEGFKGTHDATYPLVRLIGTTNVLPVQYMAEQRPRNGIINPDDTDRMAAALKQNKTLVVVGHKPVLDGIMPDKPGSSPALAAFKAGKNAIILPVAVQIGEADEILGNATAGSLLKTAFRRPPVSVKIGEPFSVDPGDTDRETVLHSRFARRANQSRDPDKTTQDGTIVASQSDIMAAQTHETRQILDMANAKVMEALAKLVPPNKRGKWGNNSPEH